MNTSSLSSPSLPRTPTPAGRSSVIGLRLVALVLAAAAVLGARVYPADPTMLAGLMLAYAALLWWRPLLWLLLVPALLPLLDFAPWTGWFYFEEIDLLLLVSAAIGYWRLAPQRRTARTPPFVAVMLGLLALAYIISTVLALGLHPVIDANAFASYLSPFNSVRIAKALAWALVLLPLLLRSAGPDLTNLQRYLVPGMLVGLGGVCAAAIVERGMFPGLMNFAADYRITAPFSAMHTGGAALDGYLALAVPFIAAWLLAQRAPLRVAAAMLLLVAGSYVGLATFSRGVYMAYAAAALVFAGVGGLRAVRSGSLGVATATGVVLMLGLTGYALMQVFATSGYRGLAASLILLAAALLVATLRWSLREVVVALLFAVLLGALSLVLESGAGGWLHPLRGAYGAFAGSALMLGAAGWLLLTTSATARSAARPLALTALLWMAANTALVAQHWGGNGALPAIALPLIIATALLLANSLPQRQLWRRSAPLLRFGFFCSVALALAIPMSASYYMSSRLATVRDDLDVRLAHWSEALTMMTPGVITSLFGMGPGSYPATYVFRNRSAELPGNYRYEREGSNAFLRLGAPQYQRGYGEVLRMLQRLPLRPQTPYTLSLDIRRDARLPAIEVAVCERQLLYPQGCIAIPVPLPAKDDGAWHHYTMRFDSGMLGGRTWALLPVPTQLQIASYGDRTVMDIDNVSVIDQRSGTQLIRNGSFSDGNDGWFFSSDHSHLPWHVKNLPLNVYFDLGWLGLAALVLLLAHALLTLLRASLQPLAEGTVLPQVYLAALTGFLLVGLFDSLLDVPRVALLFFLVLITATLRPARHKIRRRRRSAG